MREDFENLKTELNHIGIVRVCTDFYHTPNSRLFAKSPITNDKHWSLKLYPASNSFYDYSGGAGGDIIRLIAYVRDISNWQALKLLREFYGLDSRENDGETRQKIQPKGRRSERKFNGSRNLRRLYQTKLTF